MGRWRCRTAAPHELARTHWHGRNGGEEHDECSDDESGARHPRAGRAGRLAVNVTIAGERGILTPTLTGAQPALYTVNGRTVRPLGGESDKALALLQSLDESQRAKAVLGFRVADLVLGPGQDGKTIQPEGLRASEMNARQRQMLLDVIAEWSGIVHESAAAARLAEIRAGLGETWFAWSGPTTGAPGQNIAAYYRIQGPNLVIEYAPQRMGGDPSMHVHTMYRDPTNDYGARLVRK